jgi:hypothetical protein
MVVVVGCTLVAVDLIGAGLLRSYLTTKVDVQLGRVDFAQRVLDVPTTLPQVTQDVQRVGSVFGGRATAVTCGRRCPCGRSRTP